MRQTLTWILQLVATAAMGATVGDPIRAAVFSKTGEAVLTSQQAALTAERLVALFGSCSLDSKSSADVFQKRIPESDWAAAIKAPRVHVTWPTPVWIRRQAGDVRLTEGVVPLDLAAPYWFSRDGQSVVMWTKCRWPDMAAILCDPLVLPHLDPAARKQCAEFGPRGVGTREK